jgi:hypothetical protein
MCSLCVEREQQRPNESFVEILHIRIALLLLMLVIVLGMRGAPGGRALPFSFPDAKLAEHRVENLFHIDKANDFADCAQRFIKINRGIFRR